MLGTLLWYLFVILFVAAIAFGVYVYFYWTTSPSCDTAQYITFKSSELKQMYGTRKIPISTLHEAYFDEQIDLKGDVLDILKKRKEFTEFKITPEHVKFILTHFVPETLLHSREQDEKQVTTHYDRGNDFFSWFLGDRMIYTSGIFTNDQNTETLENAQDNKLALVCEKMHLKEGMNMLDIGCGWGTLLRYAAKNFNVDVTGVTLSKEGKAWHDDLAQKEGVADKAKVLRMDYRDIPTDQRFDRISCIEMAEHVGVKNFQKFMRQIYHLLKDDGLFYMQIAGLRRAWQWEDIVWGLFMDKYIFCGADASTPLGFTVNELEKAGFEIHSVENIGVHYSYTINKWYDNWIKNKEKVVAKYGERLFRLWAWFLAWSVIIASQGSSTCWQIVLNKNKNEFNRAQWVTPTRI